ncbi:hypothetical protein SFRURICE_017090 [Spodoptera frugiperda]|nr:hypothetical protein SFRURICE_017090 [Spodoptera frugiperda]
MFSENRVNSFKYTKHLRHFYIDDEIQRIFHPLNFTLSLFLCSKFRIKNNLIVTTPVLCLITFYAICMFSLLIFVIEYSEYYILQNTVLIGYYIVYCAIMAIGFTIMFLVELFNRQNNCLLLTMFQRIHSFINLSSHVHTYVFWNWISVTTILIINLVIAALFYIILNQFNLMTFISDLTYFLLDLNVVYAISVISLLTKSLAEWNKSVLELKNEPTNNTDALYYEKMYETYLNIMETYCLYKKLFQALIFYHAVDTFYRTIFYSGSYLEMRIMTNSDKGEMRAMCSLAFMWLPKNMILLITLSVYCEKFYMTVEEVKIACILSVKDSNCSKYQTSFYKKVLQTNRTFSKMTACGLFYIDAMLPIRLLLLTTNYVIENKYFPRYIDLKYRVTSLLVNVFYLISKLNIILFQTLSLFCTETLRNMFRKNRVTSFPYTKDLQHFYLGSQIQSMFYPLNFALSLYLCSKFRIKNNLVITSPIPCLVTSYVICMIFLSASIYILYFEYNKIFILNTVLVWYYMFYFIITGIGFTTIFFGELFNRKNNCLLLLKFQRIHCAIFFSRHVQRFIVWNWIAVTTTITVNLLITALFYTIMNQFTWVTFISDLTYFILDLNVVYAISIISLLTKSLAEWNKLVLELKNEQASNTDACRLYYENMYETYLNIMETYCLCKKLFQALLLNKLKLIINFFQYALATLAFMWLPKNMILLITLSVYCEKFYMTVEEVKIACILFVTDTNCSKYQTVFYKKVLQTNRTFSKMTACGLFYIDAMLPIRLLLLTTNYVIVLLQFAFLCICK